MAMPNHDDNFSTLLPRSSCVVKGNSAIACDDYFKYHDDAVYRDYSCCAKCGWDPDVKAARVKRIRRELGATA